jgi:hypothetical protein
MIFGFLVMLDVDDRLGGGLSILYSFLFEVCGKVGRLEVRFDVGVTGVVAVKILLE